MKTALLTTSASCRAARKPAIIDSLASRFLRVLFLSSLLSLGVGCGALRASTVSFSPSQYTVNEVDGSVVLRVTLDRSADPDPGDTVTVDYKTLSGTATGS